MVLIRGERQSKFKPQTHSLFSNPMCTEKRQQKMCDCPNMDCAVACLASLYNWNLDQWWILTAEGQCKLKESCVAVMALFLKSSQESQCNDPYVPSPTHTNAHTCACTRTHTFGMKLMAQKWTSRKAQVCPYFHVYTVPLQYFCCLWWKNRLNIAPF